MLVAVAVAGGGRGGLAATWALGAVALIEAVALRAVALVCAPAERFLGRPVSEAVARSGPNARADPGRVGRDLYPDLGAVLRVWKRRTSTTAFRSSTPPTFTNGFTRSSNRPTCGGGRSGRWTRPSTIIRARTRQAVMDLMSVRYLVADHADPAQVARDLERRGAGGGRQALAEPDGVAQGLRRPACGRRRSGTGRRSPGG